MHEIINTTALVIGYSIIYCAVITLAIVATFYISDRIAFKKYQKKSMKKIMNHANEEPPQLLCRRNQNTIEEPKIITHSIDGRKIIWN